MCTLICLYTTHVDKISDNKFDKFTWHFGKGNLYITNILKWMMLSQSFTLNFKIICIVDKNSKEYKYRLK